MQSSGQPRRFTISVKTRLWAIAAVTIGLVVACDRVPLTSPTGSTISVSVDQGTLPINGQATVRATVIESAGTPVHNGTQVIFTSSLGRFNPPEAATQNGIAITTFLAGTISGTTRINAYSGGASTGSGNSSGSGVEVRIGTAGAERISVRSEPTNVPITGGTVAIVATLFDASGNPISNTPLSFSTDFGTLSANSAVTDANGDARVSLTTNRSTAVTVTAGSKTQTYTLNALSPPSVTLSCGTTATATVGVPVNCTITTGASGNSSSSAPIQNVTINWGDGSGEQPHGMLNGASIVSHTYQNPGAYQVIAAATDANSQRGTAVISLTVTRTLPTVALTCPSTMTVGVPGAFTVAPPSTPGPIPITNVTLDFGDGTSRNLGAISGSQSFTKAYGSEGGFTATATVTDQAGQTGRSSCSVVVTRGSAPTVALTQTSNTSTPATIGSPESFNVAVTGGTGSIRQVVVFIDGTGQELYNSSSGGTFATDRVKAGDILTARATDSAGNVGQTQLIVQ